MSHLLVLRSVYPITNAHARLRCLQMQDRQAIPLLCDSVQKSAAVCMPQHL